MRKGKRAEGSTIQPADRHSDRLASDPAGGDRRRPDPGAGTMKGGEKMKEIATLKSDSEFKEFLEGFRTVERCVASKATHQKDASWSTRSVCWIRIAYLTSGS